MFAAESQKKLLKFPPFAATQNPGAQGSKNGHGTTLTFILPGIVGCDDWKIMRKI